MEAEIPHPWEGQLQTSE